MHYEIFIVHGISGKLHDLQLNETMEIETLKTTVIFHTLIAAGMFASNAANAAQIPYTLDLGHAYIGWEIDHFGYSNTVGQFRQFDGDFLIDDTDFENSLVTFTIDVSSIDSNHVGRDNHLRAEDILNVETFSTIKFVSTTINMSDEKSGTIIGDLTFMGTTEPLELTFNITDIAKYAAFLPRYDELSAIGVEATGRFDRVAHGLDALNFPGSPLGQFIDLNIHFDLVDCNEAPANNIPCQYGRNDDLEFPNE